MAFRVCQFVANEFGLHRFASLLWDATAKTKTNVQIRRVQHHISKIDKTCMRIPPKMSDGKQITSYKSIGCTRRQPFYTLRSYPVLCFTFRAVNMIIFAFDWEATGTVCCSYGKHFWNKHVSIITVFLKRKTMSRWVEYAECAVGWERVTKGGLVARLTSILDERFAWQSVHLAYVYIACKNFMHCECTFYKCTRYVNKNSRIPITHYNQWTTYM